jgi:type IV pilus assembly protein PilB
MLEKSKFGNRLLKENIVTEEILKKAVKRLEESNEKTPSSLAKILVSEFHIPHDSIYSTLAELYAFRKEYIALEKIDEKQIQETRNILQQFPESFRKKLFFHKIFPYKIISKTGDRLKVLSADPTNKLTQQIPEVTDFKKYEIVYCPLNNLMDIMNLISPQKNEFLELLEEVGDEVVDVEKDDYEVDKKELDEKINKSQLVNLFEGALVEAVRSDVSDVHIIASSETSFEVYFRLDGKLQIWHRQENTMPEAFAAVIKDRFQGIDRFERDEAQDGFAQRFIDDHIIRFRISIIPIVSSEFHRRFESVVIRVIDDRKVITDFRKLGFQELAEKEFHKAISSSKGIVIVTGPTGSGKSTTLMAALHYVIDPTKNVLTCEDPVEYVINGARQLKISHKMTFDQAIRSILRHDPDVVMVGEIRDKQTAELAVKLANTGHLTLSTLHTNDAPSAVSRLYKMGIEPFLLAYSINIIIAQRLVRKLCDKCKQPLPKEKWSAALEFGIAEEDLEAGKVYEPVGCSKCSGGYKGRINIAEALYFYPDISEAIMKAGDEIDVVHIRKLAEKHGMLSMRESGLDRILQGYTSIAEVAYATSENK